MRALKNYVEFEGIIKREAAPGKTIVQQGNVYIIVETCEKLPRESKVRVAGRLNSVVVPGTMPIVATTIIPDSLTTIEGGN